MKNFLKDKAVLGILFGIMLLNSIFVTHNIKIADELSYLGWSFQILNSLEFKGFFNNNEGIEMLKLFKYPMGTSSLIACWYLIGGRTLLHHFGLLCWVFSVLISWKTLTKLKMDNKSLIHYGSFFPVLLIMRTFMSENPTLVLSAIYVYILCVVEKKTLKILLLSFIAGFSLWFRESSFLLFLSPLIMLLLKFYRFDKKIIFHFIIGLISGLIPRWCSAYYFYNDMFYVKNPGYGFSLKNIPLNLVFFGLALFFFFIGFLTYARWNSKLKLNQKAILLPAVVIYVFFILCYGYDALLSSGWNSTILESRFYIPLIPFAVVLLNNSSAVDNLNDEHT